MLQSQAFLGYGDVGLELKKEGGEPKKGKRVVSVRGT
jgi:hypothetical protein